MIRRRALLVAAPALLLPRKARAQWWPWWNAGGAKNYNSAPVQLTGIAVFGASSDGTILVGAGRVSPAVVRPCYWLPPSTAQNFLNGDAGGLVATSLSFGAGILKNSATCCSADGSIVAGQESDQAVWWNRATDIKNVLTLPSGFADPSGVRACSSDGTKFAGFATTGSNMRAVYWGSGAPISLTALGSSNAATCISSNGLVIGGVSGTGKPCVWDDLGAIIELSSSGQAVGCSPSLSIALGAPVGTLVGSGGANPAVWVNGIKSELPVTFASNTSAMGISTNSEFIVGYQANAFAVYDPCWWSAFAGYNRIDLNDPSASDGFPQAFCISADGNIIGGRIKGTSSGTTDACWWQRAA